ncbi:immunity protein TriTu family protein [Streptosporangium saharense]|uniref:immunity protein TriTu family protein n=1 Tax=Streptosporangium saharense TaxID=1706840 RepID=UPI00332A01C1
MLKDGDLLDYVRAWVSEKGTFVRDHTVEFVVNESPEDREPKSIRLIFDADRKLSEIVVWADGNAELSFADIDSREEFSRHCDIESMKDLEAALNVVLEWVVGSL